MESSWGEEGPYIAEWEIEGFPPIILSEVPVISSKTEVIEVTNEKDTIISKKPGKTKYASIVLVTNLDHFPEQLRNRRHETIEGVFANRWGRATNKEPEKGKVKIQHIFFEGDPPHWPPSTVGGSSWLTMKSRRQRYNQKDSPSCPGNPLQIPFFSSRFHLPLWYSIKGDTPYDMCTWK